MKKFTFKVICGAAVVAAGIFVASLCFGNKTVRGSADTAFTSDSGYTSDTAYAETAPAIKIDPNALKVVQSLQSAFRSISSGVLPSVVEIDVVEKTKTGGTSRGGIDDFLPFLFGNPQQVIPREYEQRGLGSGVIVRRTGDTVYVLTNCHVAGKATDINVKLNDGQEFPGKLVGADERQDIALVSFQADKNTEIVVAKLGDSDQVQTGDICLAMGAPLGYRQSVTQGIVSATGRSGDDIGNMNNFIQTDAAINQGNSGGPLVNIYGEVIGINTWIASSSGGSVGLGFALPINSIKKAIDDFIANGKLTYGWLGVSLVEISEQYKESLGVKGKNGAFASQVFITSPAGKGGFQPGDFVTALNGEAVKNQNDLIMKVAYLPVGKVAEFKVIRSKKEIVLKVTIEERSEKVSADNSKIWPGFVAAPVTDDIKKKLKIDDGVEGVVLTGVLDKSPAAALRLQEGDVITAVNGKSVKNIAEFYKALDTSSTKEFWFDVVNNGHTISTGHYKIGK